jgi:spore germination protein
MILYVVQQGDTINSIADRYKKDTDRLIQENGLMNPGDLAIGQVIVIVYPKQIYTVQEGDTLQGIADKNGVTVKQIYRNNPYLLERENIYPGENLVITYEDEKIMNIATNGYVYPYIEHSVLIKNLIFLTYLSIFSYTITAEGQLNDINDIDIINLAKSYGVAPIMVVSNANEAGNISSEIVHQLLNNQDSSNNLLNNILSVLKMKGYYGVNIDIPYIRKEDRDLFHERIANLTNALNQEGFQVFVTITPYTFEADSGLSYELIDYTTIGHIPNGIVLISYSWGYPTEIPFETVPYIYIQQMFKYITSQIPPEKIMCGITTIGYIWELPYAEGYSRVDTVSFTNAIQLASDRNAEIQYNEMNLSSYYYLSNQENYLVFFHDARGSSTFLQLIPDFGLQGVSIWNVMYHLPQTFFVINTQYEIISINLTES